MVIKGLDVLVAAIGGEDVYQSVPAGRRHELMACREEGCPEMLW